MRANPSQAPVSGDSNAERFRRIAEHAPVGIFEADPEGRYRFVNARWSELAGIGERAALEDGWQAAVHPADLPRFLRAWKLREPEAPDLHLQFRFLHSDGTVVWVRCGVQSVRDHRGRLLQYVGTVTDITELVELTMSLRTTASDAEGSREDFRILAEAMPNLVWRTDAHGRLEYANERFQRYAGAGVERLNVDGARVIHPADVKLALQLWRDALASGTPYEATYRMRSQHDGAYRWFLTGALPVHSEGFVTGWVGTATDIDAQVRANEGLRFSSEAAIVVSSTLDPKSIVDRFVQLALDYFADGCVVVLAGENDVPHVEAFAVRDEAHAARLHALGNFIAERGGTRTVIQSGEPLLVSHFDDSILIESTDDDALCDALLSLGIRTVVAVPLTVAGSVAGAVVFYRTDDTLPYGQYDVEIATNVSRQLAVAMQNARSFEHIRDSARRFRILAKISDELFSSLDTKQTLKHLVDSLAGELADFAAFFFIEPDGGIRTGVTAHRDAALAKVFAQLEGMRVLRPEVEVAFGKDLAGHETRVIVNVHNDELPKTLRPYAIPVYEALERRAAVSIPLYAGDSTFGALVAYGARPDAFDAESVALLEEIGRRASLALEHARSFERERRVAQTLQEASLPAALPAFPGTQLSAMYAPATTDVQVGGDWYDAVELENGRLLLTIGDVTGRGVKAAVIMSKLRHAINAVAMYQDDPARILDAAERILVRGYPEALATAFVAVYDRDSRMLHYANAGHPRPVIRLSNGTTEELSVDGLPLGLRSFETPSESRSRSLSDVSALVLYTDGLIEATREILAGQKTLHQAVANEAIVCVRNPAAFVRDVCLSGDVDDDVAIVVMTFPHFARWTFDAENAEAAHHARGEFVQQLRSAAGPESDLSAAELIFGELVGNVVRHAPGAIDIVMEWDDGRAVLHVIDRGPGFSLDRPEADLMSESGRGLWLIQVLSLNVQVEIIPQFGAHMRVTLPVYTRGSAAHSSDVIP